MREIITKDTLFVKGEDGKMVLSQDAIDNIHDMEVTIKEVNKTYKKYKAAVLAGMEAYGLKKVETDELLITYVEPTERIGIDNDKLWADYTDVAFECQKFTPVSSSIRIKAR